jgi:hypothetical protein
MASSATRTRLCPRVLLQELAVCMAAGGGGRRAVRRARAPQRATGQAGARVSVCLCASVCDVCV